MLLTSLVLAASTTRALATPLNVTITQHVALHKRGAPVEKKNDYTNQQIQQIKEGHLDTIKLASMVVAQSENPDTFDPIFQNYFRRSDRDTLPVKAGLLSIYLTIDQQGQTQHHSLSDTKCFISTRMSSTKSNSLPHPTLLVSDQPQGRPQLPISLQT